MWDTHLIAAFGLTMFPLYCRVHSCPCLEAYLDCYEVSISLVRFGQLK